MASDWNTLYSRDNDGTRQGSCESLFNFTELALKALPRGTWLYSCQAWGLHSKSSFLLFFYLISNSRIDCREDTHLASLTSFTLVAKNFNLRMMLLLRTSVKLLIIGHFFYMLSFTVAILPHSLTFLHDSIKRIETFALCFVLDNVGLADEDLL